MLITPSTSSLSFTNSVNSKRLLSERIPVAICRWITVLITFKLLFWSILSEFHEGAGCFCNYLRLLPHELFAPSLHDHKATESVSIIRIERLSYLLFLTTFDYTYQRCRSRLSKTSRIKGISKKKLSRSSPKMNLMLHLTNM